MDLQFFILSLSQPRPPFYATCQFDYSHPSIEISHGRFETISLYSRFLCRSGGYDSGKTTTYKKDSHYGPSSIVPRTSFSIVWPIIIKCLITKSSKKTVGTIIKNSTQVTISVATNTTKWMRPDVAVDAMADPFTRAVSEFPGQLPEDTREICARSSAILPIYFGGLTQIVESEHPSGNDSRDHFTGVCFNSKNDGKSMHFPTKK